MTYSLKVLYFHNLHVPILLERQLAAAFEEDGYNSQEKACLFSICSAASDIMVIEVTAKCYGSRELHDGGAPVFTDCMLVEKQPFGYC